MHVFSPHPNKLPLRIDVGIFARHCCPSGLHSFNASRTHTHILSTAHIFGSRPLHGIWRDKLNAVLHIGFTISLHTIEVNWATLYRKQISVCAMQTKWKVIWSLIDMTVTVWNFHNHFFPKFQKHAKLYAIFRENLVAFLGRLWRISWNSFRFIPNFIIIHSVDIWSAIFLLQW